MTEKFAVNITDLIKMEFKYRHKPTGMSCSADNTENPGIGFDSIIGLERSQSRFVTGFVYLRCLRWTFRLRAICRPPCLYVWKSLRPFCPRLSRLYIKTVTVLRTRQKPKVSSEAGKVIISCHVTLITNIKEH